MSEEKDTREESVERRALRELVGAIRSQAIEGGGRLNICTSNPIIVSAFREAEAVLGVEVSK